MRQKKSNLMYYVLAAVVLAAIVFVVLHDVPMKIEHVEQDIPVNL